MSRSGTFRVAVRKFGPFESSMAKQWASFEAVARTGLQFEAVPMDLHPLTDALFEQNGLRNGDWDVAFLNTDWVESCAREELVADLGPRLRAGAPEDYPSGWTQSLLRLHEVNGAVLGLPYHDGPECLIYRKDLFDDPATPLQLPATWDDFRRAAGFFQRPEQGLYGTIFAAYPDGHNSVYDFCLQLWSRGGELFDGAGGLRLDTPAAVEGLDFYRGMVKDSGCMHPRARECDSVQSGLAFAAGEVAMMVNWFGFAAMAETIADSRVAGKVDIAPIPHGPGGHSVSLNVYWILSIARGAVHADIAWRFLRHCASKEMDKALTLEGAIGCRRSTWADADVNRTVPFYHKLAELHANAREMPRLAGWQSVATIIDEAVTAALDSAIPSRQLLNEAQAKIDARK